MSGVAAYAVGFILSWPPPRTHTHTSAAVVIPRSHADAHYHQPEQTPTQSLLPQTRTAFYTRITGSLDKDEPKHRSDK